MTKPPINEWFDFAEKNTRRNPNESEVGWLKMPRIEIAYNVDKLASILTPVKA